MNIRAVIFDLDGTIVDAPYDWTEIRQRMGIRETPILSYLSGLEEPERSRKERLLTEFEEDATKKARLKRGMKGFFLYLKRRGLKTALVTNNSRKNAEFLQRKFGLRFDVVMTRESGLWKPSGAPFQEAMRQLGVRREECAVIGDSLFDLKASSEAGIHNVFLLVRERDRTDLGGAERFSAVAHLRERFEKLLGTKSENRSAGARQRKAWKRVL